MSAPVPPHLLSAWNVSLEGMLDRDEPSRVCGVSASFEPATLTILCGTPGCGKNLLLRLLGLLEVPAEGEVCFSGTSVAALDPAVRTQLRNEKFGFVFSEPFLLPSLLAIENVAMPLLKLGAAEVAEAQARTVEMLEFVGLQDAAHDLVNDLTLLEQYRLSLARALVNRPSVLIAENIDHRLAGADLEAFAVLLKRARREFGVAVIATASENVVGIADRTIALSAGHIARDSRLGTTPHSS